MPYPPHLLPLEARVRAAWQTPRAATSITSDLLPDLVRHRHELLPRFTAYYTQLRALPRRVRRALQRQWRLPLAGIALLLALGQSPGLAATIPVGGACALVDALTAANTDTATGGCPAGSGADTIVLPVGSTQTLTEVNNDTYGPTGLPVISSVVTIAGQGSTIARASDAPEFRLFAVNNTGELTLQETTVSGGGTFGAGGGVANYGGTLTVLNSTISGNDGYDGGGIWNSGTLTVTNSTLAGNGAGEYSAGGGIWNSGTLTVTNSTLAGNITSGFHAGNGAGIWNSGTVTVTDSTLAGNVNTAFHGDLGGGGIENSGTLTLINSTLAGNDGANGGGIRNTVTGTVTVLHSTLSGNTASSGGGVANYGGTLTVTNSTLSGNTASFGGGGIANDYGGTLTVLNSTISGNDGDDGGGIWNSGTLTLTNSTLSGNDGDDGGGIWNSGTLTLTNSTLSGNAAGYYGDGGGIWNSGTLTLTNSTLSGNDGSFDGGGIANYGVCIVMNSTLSGNVTSNWKGGSGGGIANSGTLTLANSILSGNAVEGIKGGGGDEISNSGGTVLADNHNLFGVDGNPGVAGFSPGATDIVPPAGVQLADILDPTLAFHGGFTQTHALVPGSPAIDAGGPVCTDASGNPLPTDQRGRPRVVDGTGDGTAACDIGAFEFFPLVNDLVTLDPALETAFEPTAVPGGPAGTFTITATFTNTSATPLRVPFFRVIELSGGTLLLNADEGTQGVGATLTPEVGDSLLAPGEAVTVDFVLGLQVQAPFTFLVDLFGEPLP